MSINGVRFGHVAFKVSDTERSVRGYAEAFGAQKIYRAEARGERPELMFLEFARGQLIELFSGGKNILLLPTRSATPLLPAGRRPRSGTEHLAQMNVKPVRKFIGRAEQRIAFINDPDGNSIEVMQIPSESPLYRD
jgi:catechol 2,3-dioxygenase-like lactoylglutathione lyase family enzyme